MDRTTVMTPSLRKPFGTFVILALIAVLAIGIASASPWIGTLHPIVQTLIYLVAGLIWIAPLRPLLMWMETGKWRA